MKREDVVNFNAGPAGLPSAALEKANSELLNFEDTGMSIMEHSHRGASYDKVHKRALALVRELMGVPDSHGVLFVQGGASQCFATVPMNFLRAGSSADYIVTGSWSKKALSEAQLVGKARAAASGEVDGKQIRIPTQADLDLDPKAAYLHLTSNNTIAGTQFHEFPDSKGVPLVADMSSDIMWRPIDVSKFSLIYAGAQKNIGPAGVAVIIVDKAWVEKASTSIPKILRFKTHLDADSLFNTPPTFSIYLIKNILEDVLARGGLEAMAEKNAEKAKILYGAIDESDGYYNCPVEKSSRSSMNVVFRLPSEDLEGSFIAKAAEQGLLGLKGHRSVGGIRASIYNAVSVAGVERLAAFMRTFRS